MTGKPVFLLDVDNTLLDNDAIIDDLKRHLEREFDGPYRERYWSIFAERRDETGYCDYLGALQRLRADDDGDLHFLKIALYLLEYPFEKRLFPAARELIRRFQKWGDVVVLSEGDVVFQPLKILRSGLLDAVNRQALVYIHKDGHLRQAENQFPAGHYVLIDDRLHHLAAAKARWGARVTTIFSRQGGHARRHHGEAAAVSDLTINLLDELLELQLAQLVEAARPISTASEGMELASAQDK